MPYIPWTIIEQKKDNYWHSTKSKQIYSYRKYENTVYLLFQPQIINILIQMHTTKPTPLVLQKIRSAIELLRVNGMQYESVIAQKYPEYDFIYPKSPHYKLYTQQLLRHLPFDTPELHISAPKTMEFEGSIEQLPVGAMCQIVRQELRQGHAPYEPFDSSIYQHKVTFDPLDHHLTTKVTHLLEKYANIMGPSKKIAIKEESQNRDKSQIFRRQLGTNQDGSLGAYGGKKFEGLGTHDEFNQFRRQLSQQYYSNIQEKRQN